MKAYEYQQFGLNNLVLAERYEPQPAGHEVVAEFHAVRRFSVGSSVSWKRV